MGRADLLSGDGLMSLLTVYDTIFMFGRKKWNRVEWGETFSQGSLRKTLEKRLERMDRFCDKWGIEIQKQTREEWNPDGRTRYVTYRRFTPASKRRVDTLLGPVLQELQPSGEDLLRSPLGVATQVQQEIPSKSLRHAQLGQRA